MNDTAGLEASCTCSRIEAGRGRSDATSEPASGRAEPANSAFETYRLPVEDRIRRALDARNPTRACHLNVSDP